jgi:hypothetical protein
MATKMDAHQIWAKSAWRWALQVDRKHSTYTEVNLTILGPLPWLLNRRIFYISRMSAYITNVHYFYIFVYFLPNTSGLVCAKNLRKRAEKAFASSTLVSMVRPTLTRLQKHQTCCVKFQPKQLKIFDFSWVRLAVRVGSDVGCPLSSSD